MFLEKKGKCELSVWLDERGAGRPKGPCKGTKMCEDRVLSLPEGVFMCVSMWLRQLDPEVRDQSPATGKTELHTC